jgi:lysophospholipase L1-like esterase
VSGPSHTIRPIALLLWIALPFVLTGCADYRMRTPTLFMGDSITRLWSQSVSFRSHYWTGSGIPGQTCSQILARLQSSIDSFHPGVVHILCGTNDIREQTEDAQSTEQAIDEMISMVQKRGMKVVIGTVPPVRSGMAWTFSADVNDQIVELNDWIRNYASQHQVPLADYHKAMVAGDGSLDRSLTYDGVHPNVAGCDAMTRVAAAVLSSP